MSHPSIRSGAMFVSPRVPIVREIRCSRYPSFYPGAGLADQILGLGNGRLRLIGCFVHVATVIEEPFSESEGGCLRCWRV